MDAPGEIDRGAAPGAGGPAGARDGQGTWIWRGGGGGSDHSLRDFGERADLSDDHADLCAGVCGDDGVVDAGSGSDARVVEGGGAEWGWVCDLCLVLVYGIHDC